MRFRNKNTGEVKDFSPTLINSALLSAQNRQRYYWANWEFGQPEDKGITLADIIEDGKMLTAGLTQQMLEVKAGQKTNALTTVQKDNVITTMKPGRYPLATSAGRNKQGVRVLRGKGDKVAPITARYYKGVKSDGAPFIYHGDKDKGDSFDYEADKPYYRKLTPTECERLQTLPENYSSAIETLSYSMYNYKEVNNKEDLYLCDVKLMDAKENREQKSMVTYALCTTSDLLGMELMSCQRLKAIKSQSVNIAIERLGKKAEGLEECVIDITKTGLDMETLYTQIRSEINLDQEATKSAIVVKTSTKRLLRITSEESCQEVRLFTILIAIRLITQLRICTYVTDRANIHYCIDSLKKSQGNLLSVDLSYLKMETTRQTVSNTQRYKMLGNGWTVDVIAHIFNSI